MWVVVGWRRGVGVLGRCVRVGWVAHSPTAEDVLWCPCLTRACCLRCTDAWTAWERVTRAGGMAVWAVAGWRRGVVVSLHSVCEWAGSPTAEHVLWYHISVVWVTHSCFPVPTCMDYTRMCDWGCWGHCVGRSGVETWGWCARTLCVSGVGRPLANGRGRVVVPMADPCLLFPLHRCMDCMGARDRGW